jgi:hypothetical protein
MDCFAALAMTVLLMAEALPAMTVISDVHHNTLDQILFGDDFAEP